MIETSRLRRVIVAWASLVSAVLGVAGCSTEAPKEAAKGDPAVVVDEPVTREIVDYEEFVGQTAAVNTIEIRARVTGYLDKANFVDGTEVTKDSLLFEIDPRPYLAEVARTEASVVQAEAHNKRLELDYRRAQSLMAREVMPREEFDRITGDYAEAGAALGIARANSDLAKLNVSFTKVLAPISGRISRRMVDPGNLVRADDTPLTTIVSLDPMYLYFDVDERTMLRIRRLIREGKMKSREQAEMPIEASLADEKDFPHRGLINFSENRIDAGTGTLRVRAVFPNPKPAGSAFGLRVFSPGLFMRIRLPIGDPRQALLLPEKALVTNQGEKSVWVVDAKNEAQRKNVTIGALHDGLRVIETGLKPKERVVVEGLQRIPVKEPRTVRPKQATAAARPLVARSDSTPAVKPPLAPTPVPAPVPAKPTGE